MKFQVELDLDNPKIPCNKRLVAGLLINIAQNIVRTEFESDLVTDKSKNGLFLNEMLIDGVVGARVQVLDESFNTAQTLDNEKVLAQWNDTLRTEKAV